MRTEREPSNWFQKRRRENNPSASQQVRSALNRQNAVWVGAELIPLTRNLDPVLLDTGRGDLLAETNFNAALDAHGRYEGLRFVVRLSPRVHNLIASLPKGIGFRSGLSFEQVQAFSTYLHETIHWWQHIGSTSGFMLSLSFPAQTHANLNHLRQFLEQVGPVKSIRAWATANTGPDDLGTPGATANIIVNNQFDIEAYRLLATNPDRAQSLVNDPMFANVGHTYRIALANGVLALASTFDPNHKLLPDPRVWQEEFTRLREQREPGFYNGSPITLSPIGAFHIFEGQARFAQLQYLHFGSGGKFDWDDAGRANMLAATYTSAFEVFLSQSGLDRPGTINHPVVGLFLLICDIAMNPGEAFPLPIPFPTEFIGDVDPGMRFLFLAGAVRLFCPETATAIIRYNATEYAEVSSALCRALKIFAPLEIVSEVNRWIAEGEAFRQCLARHDQGKIDALNAPLQVLFGQFASFARDKARYPHVLCWPGPNMAGQAASEDSVGVFSRQSPLFVDRAEDEMIVPVIREGRNEADVMRTFQVFYEGHALYDLTRQWITAPGRFRYDYRWLQPAGTPEQLKAWADSAFINAYGVAPDDFNVLVD